MRAADLTDAKFARAVMNGGDLRRAVAHRTRFSGADLVNADFSDASLVEADFTGAQLAGVNFSGADLSSAVFDPGALSSAKVDDRTILPTGYVAAP
jgi:uncharacterized protein YjbI with pentapeptide repeats